MLPNITVAEVIDRLDPRIAKNPLNFTQDVW